MITVNGKELKNAVKAASLVADEHSRIPVLANLLFRTTEGGRMLEIRGTDLTTDITAIVPVLVAASTLKILVNAKIIIKTLDTLLPKGKGLASSTVDLSVDGGKLIVASGAHTVKLESYDAEEFPASIPDEFKDSVLHSPVKFREALEFVLPVVSKEWNRVSMNTLCLSDTAIVGTDGYRLYVQEGFPAVPREVLIPRGSALAMLQTMKYQKDLVSVGMSFSGGRVRFEAGGVNVLAKLVDEKFPDYKQVIPQNPDLVGNFDRESLLLALDVLSVAVTKVRPGIILHLEPAGCTVGVENEEVSVDPMPFDASLEFGSKTFFIGVDLFYLRDALSITDAPSVSVELSDKMSPIKFTAGNRTAVVMPIRI